MTGTTLAATYGPISGADLEAELAQPRIADGDAQDAAVYERDGGARALPFASGARRPTATAPMCGAQQEQATRRCASRA